MFSHVTFKRIFLSLTFPILLLLLLLQNVKEAEKNFFSHSVSVPGDQCYTNVSAFVGHFVNTFYQGSFVIQVCICLIYEIMLLCIVWEYQPASLKNKVD